jgi:hypothetical protein
MMGRRGEVRSYWRPTSTLLAAWVPRAGTLLRFCWLLLRMNDLPSQSLLEEINARQDELLDELERLNQQIERVLHDCNVWRGVPTEPSVGQALAPS